MEATFYDKKAMIYLRSTLDITELRGPEKSVLFFRKIIISRDVYWESMLAVSRGVKISRGRIIMRGALYRRSVISKVRCMQKRDDPK